MKISKSKIQIAYDALMESMEGMAKDAKGWKVSDISSVRNMTSAIIELKAEKDQLTAINQELVEALELAKRSLATYGEHPIVEDKMNNAIKRAKELTNEG